MKTIYMIYEEDWGHTGVTFTDKKSAELFVKLRNKVSNAYYVKTKKLYDNLEGYIKSNKSEIIEDLKTVINKMTANYTYYDLKFKNAKYYHHMNYNELKEIVKNNAFGFSGLYEGDLDYGDNKYVKIVKSDLQVVINMYEKINKQLAKYKAILNVLEKSENLEKSTMKELKENLNEEL